MIKLTTESFNMGPVPIELAVHWGIQRSKHVLKVWYDESYHEGSRGSMEDLEWPLNKGRQASGKAESRTTVLRSELTQRIKQRGKMIRKIFWVALFLMLANWI